MNMRRIKNSIKTIWIISLIVLIYDCIDLSISIYNFSSAFDIGLSIFDVSCAIISLVVFLIASNKDIEYLKKNIALIVVGTICAFLSSILAGIFGIIVCSDIKKFNVQNFNNDAEQSASAEQKSNIQSADSNGIADTDSANNTKSMSAGDNSSKLEVYPAEVLLNKLKTLQKMKVDGEITEEEYEQIKQKMINDFKNNIK